MYITKIPFLLCCVMLRNIPEVNTFCKLLQYCETNNTVRYIYDLKITFRNESKGKHINFPTIAAQIQLDTHSLLIIQYLNSYMRIACIQLNFDQNIMFTTDPERI